MSVNIIIVSYNSLKETRECIDRLIQDMDNQTIISIYDNSSSDGTIEYLQSFNDNRLKITYGTENIGFPSAVNMLLSNSVAEVNVLLNSDCIISAGDINAISSLAKKFNAVVYPRLLNSDGSEQRSVFRFPTITKIVIGALGLVPLLNKLLKRNEGYNQINAEIVEINDYAIFACVAIPKTIIQTVGVLDGKLFFYHDDCDYGYRLKELGVKQLMNKSISVIHIGGASSSKINGFTYYHFYRSLLIICQKQFSRFEYILLRLILFIVFIIKFLLRIIGLPLRPRVPSVYGGIFNRIRKNYFFADSLVFLKVAFMCLFEKL